MIERLIDRVEEITKTDIRYILRGGFWLFTGQIVASIAALILAVTFAHLASKETYGLYKFFASAANILTSFTLSGIGVAITQSVARGYDNALIRGFKKNLQWGIIVLCISFAVGIYYALHHQLGYAFIFVLIGLFMPLTLSASLFESFLNGKKDFRTQTIYLILDYLIPTVLVIVLLFFTSSPYILYSVSLIFGCLAALFFFNLTQRKYPVQNTEDDPHFMSYSAHLSVMNIIFAIVDNIDQLLVFHYLGVVDLAIYAFAVALPEQIKALLKSVGVLALPKFSERSLPEIQSNLFKRLAGFALLTITVSLIYIALAPFIYRLLFPQYMDAVFYSQLFSISLVAIAGQVPVSILYAHKKTRALYSYNILGAIIQILLLVIFIPAYGLMGAIIARMLGRAATFIISIVLVNLLFKSAEV